MSTTPPSPATLPPIAAPAARLTPAVFRRGRRAYLIAGVIVPLILVAGVAAWSVARDRGGLPDLRADTATLARFVASDAYARLPFGAQCPFMNVLEAREDKGEIRALFNAGRISETQCRAALLEASLGEHFQRSERYARLAPGKPREAFVLGLLERKQKSREKRDGAAAPASNVRVDRSIEQLRIAAWPANVRARFEEFTIACAAHDTARDDALANAGPAVAPALTPGTDRRE